jgi:hypothetical protein
LHHLLTREITHAKMFMKALDAIGKLDDPFFGNIPPDETVKLVFNLSQDEDVRCPWNEEPDFDYVAIRIRKGACPRPPVNADDEGHDSRSSNPRKKRTGVAAPAAWLAAANVVMWDRGGLTPIPRDAVREPCVASRVLIPSQGDSHG